MSTDNIVKKILSLEKENKLFDLKYENILFYHFIRMNIYYYVVGKKNVFNRQNSFSYKKILKIFFYIIRDLLSIIRKKNLLKNKICIIQHPRKINDIDIYTGYIKKILKKHTVLHKTAGQNFILDNNSINYDLYIVNKKILSFFGISNTKKNNNVIKLITIFKKQFLLDSDFDNFIFSLVQNKINAYKIARKFLIKSNFKKIILVNSYENQDLIYAADELNIDTIELQHGVIYKNHLGYHFPNLKTDSLKSFPNKLILFGNYWRDKANYPINKKKIFTLGSPYFEHNLINTKKFNKQKNDKILILSQQTTQKYILDFISNVILKNNKFFFTYKAHPKENLRIVNNYLKKFKIQNNVEVVRGTQNIYDLFKKHSIQIGVFSTALYEGYSCELKTGIIKVPGWEITKPLIKYPNVHIIKNYKEFNEMINFRPIKFKTSYFFKSNAEKNFNKFFGKE